MLFNSLQFAIFFILVYALYLTLNHRRQNWLLVIASCVFYSAWNWKFLFLMFLSISTDYYCSNKIFASDDQNVKKKFLFVSIFVNLTILAFFKYFNFFIESLSSVLLWLFPSTNFHPALNIILPVGISFYTFEAISYTVDVYRGVMRPAKNYWDYVLFVIYFPHLIAGPIMRAKDFLPQIISPRIIKSEQFYEGCFLTFWGLFEKIFVADNLAKIVDATFASSSPYEGGKVLIAAYAFAFQIFCDFDGYSNIARGLGKCMGFEITINFRLPYFATNPVEFWRRWHISLSSWLRDYLYIPLGGNQGSKLMTYRNLTMTMLLGGLWHGASWTFVIWGGFHGVLLIAHRILSQFFSKRESSALFDSKPWFVIKVLFFFQLTCIGWLIFRATSVGQLNQMLTSICADPFQGIDLQGIRNLVFFILPVLTVQIIQYYRDDLMAVLKWPILLRVLLYISMFYCLILGGAKSGGEFIYFQF